MESRKARTRTLIQLGGLVEKADLLEPLFLNLGQDLQKDPECFEGVAVLMGALAELRQVFEAEDAEGQRVLWKERGKELLGKRTGKQT